jgi:MFS family permease
VVNRLNRRLVTSVTLPIQIAGLGLLAAAPSVATVYVGCALFGLGVGNVTTLPGLILAVEWPPERVRRLVGLVVGINQFTFAFGPSLVGVAHDWSAGYAAALAACMALEGLAAVIVLLGPGRVPSPAPPRGRCPDARSPAADFTSRLRRGLRRSSE